MDVSRRKALIALGPGFYEYPEIGNGRMLVTDVAAVLGLPDDDLGAVGGLRWMDEAGRTPGSEDALSFVHNHGRLYQGEALCRYGLASKAVTVLHPGNWNAAKGWNETFNTTYAGGGVVCGFSDHGYWDNTEFVGRRTQGRPPLAVDNKTGTVAVVRDGGNGGWGVFEGDTYRELGGGTGHTFLASFEDGLLVVWSGGAEWRWQVGSPAAVKQPSVPFVWSARWSGGWNVGAQKDYGIVAWPDGHPEQAWQFLSDPADYAPNGPAYHVFAWTIRRAGNKVHVCSAWNEGERPGEQRRWTIDLDAPTPWKAVDLFVEPSATPVITVPETPHTPIVVTAPAETPEPAHADTPIVTTIPPSNPKTRRSPWASFVRALLKLFGQR